MEVPDLMKTFYAEGSSALRHYSLCIFNLRALTVAQGLVLVTGSTLLLKDHSFIGAGAVSLFGILFTLALYAMQRSYWICFDALLKSVVEIESGIAGGSGPWGAYDAAKDKAYGRIWWKILVKHGPFWLFWLGFLGVLFVAVVGQGGGYLCHAGSERSGTAAVERSGGGGQPCRSSGQQADAHR